MPETLAIAIGTVLSVLENVESKHGHIENVHLVMLNNVPTNVIEFQLGTRTFEVLVSEKRTMRKRPRHQHPSTTQVVLKVREYEEQQAKDGDREELTLSLGR